MKGSINKNNKIHHQTLKVQFDVSTSYICPAGLFAPSYAAQNNIRQQRLYIAKENAKFILLIYWSVLGL